MCVTMTTCRMMRTRCLFHSQNGTVSDCNLLLENLTSHVKNVLSFFLPSSVKFLVSFYYFSVIEKKNKTKKKREGKGIEKFGYPCYGSKAIYLHVIVFAIFVKFRRRKK